MSVSSPVIDYIDTTNRYIYLLQGVTEYHPVEDIYKEIRYRRKVDESLRKFDMPVTAYGNIPKGGGKYTPRYARFNNGWKIVPYDENSSLYVTGEQITDSGESGPACIDTTTLLSSVIIQYEPPAAEIVRDEVSLAAIAFMSFDNEVWHDVAGNTFAEHIALGLDPKLLGNTQYPASDRDEAVAIAKNKNITQLRTTGVHEFSTATDISGFRLHGDSAVNDIMVIDSAPDVTNVSIRDLTISGTLDGGTTLRDCLVSGINFFNGIFHQCAFNTQPVYLGGGIGVTAMFLSCYSAVPGGNARPCIDFDNTETNLDVRGWLGGLELKNKSTALGEVSLDMSSGTLYIRSSCTAGEITVRGIGRCVDESGPGCNVITTGLIDPDYVQAITFNDRVYVNTVLGKSGTAFPLGNDHNPVDNVTDAMTIAANRGLDTFFVSGEITITGIADGLIQQMTIKGSRRNTTIITFDNILVEGLVFEDCTIIGTFKAGSFFETKHCRIKDVSGASITGTSTVLDGVTQLGAGESNFYSCYDGIPGVEVAEISVGACTSLGIWDYQGGLRITNMNTVGTVVSAMITAGRLFVDSTDVEGDIIVKGMANLVGTTGGTTIDSDGLITKDAMQDYIWGTGTGDKVANSALGKAVIAVDDSATTIYERDDSATISHEFTHPDKRTRIPV